jgi:flavin-dependent dehydrogenase
MAQPVEVDLLVVGAGTAGAATAAFAAEAGMRVVCLDRRPVERAGARWVNGVTRAALAEVGVVPREGLASPPPFHLIGRRHRVTVRRHDVLDLDMPALVAQLQARATAAGAELRGEVAVIGREDHIVTSADGERWRARWIVDASGLAGAGLLNAPPVAARHLCAAAQGVYEVRDRAGAAAYFASLGVRPGEIAAEVGIAGGYSVRNVRLHGDDRVAVLTGAIPADGHAGGKALRDDLVRAQPWIGAMISGGSGAIPLRRPREELTDGTVAVIGDAACQVFSAHGSGIGAGMIAGKLVVDTVARGGTLFDYERAWHRRFGGLFAAYDAVRRWNQGMTADDIDRVMARGLLDEAFAGAGVDQVAPQVGVAAVLGKLPAAVREPAVMALAARTGALLALGARMPPRGRRRRAWSAAMQRLLPV